MRKRMVATDVLLVKQHLSALGLPTIKAECEQAARECASANVDYLGFLLRLCERELADRGRRATERRIKAARFPQVKSLDDFDFTAQPTLNRPLILELARCEYLDRRESVILVGNPGTGKTHVASGLGLCACQRGKKVRFYRVTELLTQLLEEVAQSLHALALLVAHAPLEEIPQGVLQIAKVHQVVGQRVEDVVRIEGRYFLGSVPL